MGARVARWGGAGGGCAAGRRVDEGSCVGGIVGMNVLAEVKEGVLQDLPRVKRVGERASR